MAIHAIKYNTLFIVPRTCGGKTMRLYLVRHGIAERGGIFAGPDEDRALTAEGAAMMQRVARGLLSAGYLPDVILSSPLVRARQTAQILSDAFGLRTPPDLCRDLGPGGSRATLQRKIIGYTKTVGGLMLVGHQPALGEIAGDLAWGSPGHYFDLREGEVCVVDLENFAGELRGSLAALLPPEILGHIT
jgi:phosphohistidine phosphatase